VLKDAGYATACIGKWGLGMPGTGGHPNRKGFDLFYGYLSQHHAHNYYPTFLWRNEEQFGLPNVVRPMGNGALYGAGVATEKNVYAPDLFAQEALGFIDAHRDDPFFLYFATNVPHSNNEATKIRRADGAEVPDLGIYEDEDWMLGSKRHAAMITRMDRDIGAMLDRLEEHGITDNTLVIFTSDNGPHEDHAEPKDFFEPARPLRGWKMNLWEGGIRVPFIVRWPERIRGGVVSDEVGYFGDIMATFAEITGQPVPEETDSLSVLPVWEGRSADREVHEFLYWEFWGKDTGVVAISDGRWKGIIRRKAPDHLELYDLANDVGEEHDVSGLHAEIVQRIRDYIPGARSESEIWKSPLDFSEQTD
jgi:arylsulfatase A-like enzyme